MTANWPTCCMPGSWQHACRAPGSPPMPCTQVWAAQCQAVCLLHACVEHPFAWSIPLHGAPLHGVPFARRVPPCCASFTQFTFCTASLCTMHPIARRVEHPSVHCTLSTVHLLHPFACHIPLCDASLCTPCPFAQRICLHAATLHSTLLCMLCPFAGGSPPHRCLSPLPAGFVNTRLFRHAPLWLQLLWTPLSRFCFRSAAEGARTVLFCATQDGLEPFSGCYFADCRPLRPWAQGRDDAAARELWDRSERLLGLQPSLCTPVE